MAGLNGMFDTITPKATSPTMPSAATILLVEDETFVRNVAGEILEAAGYNVLRVRSSVEAMRAFQQCPSKVQLLVTDLVLPGRSGEELARDLKVLDRGLKVVFMSGYPAKIGERTGWRDAGACYLAKPFSVASFMQKVTDALSASPEAA